MKRVLLYEFFTSGGLWETSLAGHCEASLLREGQAMLAAMAANFSASGEFETIVLRDARQRGFTFPGCTVHDVDSAASERELLSRLCCTVDATLLIAPEFQSLLQTRCQWIERAGGRLLGPSSEVVAIAADKHETAERLIAAGVPAPRGVALSGTNGEHVLFPAILKPHDGAGSQGVQWIRNSDKLPRQLAEGGMRLEQFIPGNAASVAVLCGSQELRPLPACRQRLTDDGRFSYLGGSLPLPPQFNQRAQRLALAAIRSLPNPRGYLGVDLVLGEDPDGTGDAVIEINPRLTTSLIGLRAAARENFAAAMWAIAEGQPPESIRLTFRDDPLEFDADGTVRFLHKT